MDHFFIATRFQIVAMRIVDDDAAAAAADADGGRIIATKLLKLITELCNLHITVMLGSYL